jgi:hypothetical protein
MIEKGRDMSEGEGCEVSKGGGIDGGRVINNNKHLALLYYRHMCRTTNLKSPLI